MATLRGVSWSLIWMPSFFTGCPLFLALEMAVRNSRSQALAGHLKEIEAGTTCRRFQVGARVPTEVEDLHLRVESPHWLEHSSPAGDPSLSGDQTP